MNHCKMSLSTQLGSLPLCRLPKHALWFAPAPSCRRFGQHTKLSHRVTDKFHDHKAHLKDSDSAIKKNLKIYACVIRTPYFTKTWMAQKFQKFMHTTGFQLAYLQTYSCIKYICAQSNIFFIIVGCFCNLNLGTVSFDETFHCVREERRNSSRQHFQGVLWNFAMSISFSCFGKAILFSAH